MTKTTTIPVGGAMVELIDDGDAIARMTNNGKDWEPATRAIWGALVRPGDMVIDVGAYTGVYSIASALIGAKVIGLEPHPANFQRLRANAAINSVRMEMIEAAASANKGSNCLYMKRATSAICDAASLDQEQAVAVSVRTVRLDDLKLCAHVCLLKIDVEHHELDVIAGGLRMITTHRPAIVVEALSDTEAAAIDSCLYDLGYQTDITLDKRNRFYSYRDMMAFDAGLQSIDYHPGIRSVVMVYEPDSEYDVREILAYVHDMTGGTSREVMIYEGDKLMHNIKHMGNAGWVNIAKGQGNGL